MLRCSKDAAGNATESGGKEKSNREVTHQPGREVTSPCGATRAQSVRASKLASNRRHAAVRSRALPPVSKEPIRTGGVVWVPRLQRLAFYLGLYSGGPLPIQSA